MDTNSHPFRLCRQQNYVYNINTTNMKKLGEITAYIEKIKLIPFCKDKLLKLDYVLDINYLDENMKKQKFLQKGTFVFINFGINPLKLKAKVNAIVCPCDKTLAVKIYAQLF